MLDTTWTALLKWQSKDTTRGPRILDCHTLYLYDGLLSVHRQQSEEGEKNGSEDDDEEKPGKRVMGPRKKFLWDDKLRSDSQRKGGTLFTQVAIDVYNV